MIGPEKPRYVEAMFTRISGRYDLLNTLMTGGMHYRWKALAADVAARGQEGPGLDIATGTVKVTVEATAPPAHVRPGTFVTVEIVRETRPRVLVLPREAVIRELQDAYVFVADAGVAKRRAVTLGLEEAGRIEALSGVQAGDQVIVAGQGGLKDGTVIKVLPETQASALPAAPPRRARG